MCINFPFGVLNTLPHCSQVLVFLSMCMSGVSTMLMLGGSLRLTNMSFRFRLRLYATSGGLGKTVRQRSLDNNTGCNCFNFSFKSGTIGLYVVENITLSSLAVFSTSVGFITSSRVRAAALRIPSFIIPSLYPLFLRWFVRVVQCCLKSDVFEHILRILRASAYGRLDF